MRRLVPLTVAFVVLALLFAWRELARTAAERAVSTEADIERLAPEPFTADDVEKVEVFAPGKDAPEYSLVREKKSWRVGGAFRAPASGASVKKLLDTLSRAEGELRSDDSASLEQFDLTDASSVKLRLSGASGKVLMHLAVGRSSGARGAFVRDLTKKDDRAYALGEDVRGLLGLPRKAIGETRTSSPEAGFFHDKEFPQFPTSKAKRVEIVQPGRRLVLEMQKRDPKDAKGEWKVVEGGPGESLRKEGVETTLRTFGGGFRPMSLADPAKRKELGFDAPAFRVAVTDEEGTTRAVVGTYDEKADAYHVRLDAEQDPDVLYEASEFEFHQLFPRGSDLFDLPKLDVGRDGPTHLVVERKGRETIEMTRKGTKPADDWTLVRPAWPLEPRQPSLRTLGGSLSGVRVTDYLDAGELGDVETTVRFGGPTTAETDLAALRVGGKAPWGGKDRLVELPGKPGRVFVVAEASLDRVTPEPLSLFEPKVFRDVRRDDVKSVALAPGLTVVRKDDGWALKDGDAEAPADRKAVEDWIDKVLGLAVAGVGGAAEGADAQSLVVERKEGAPVSVSFGAAKDGKRPAKLGDFVCSLTDVEGLVPERKTLEAKEPPKKDEPKQDDGKK